MKKVASPETDRTFLGTDWFDLSDRRFFFGRDVESDQIASRLLSNRPVFVFGPSGAGKSSILFAGIVPELVAQLERYGSKRRVVVIAAREWRAENAASLFRWAEVKPNAELPTELLPFVGQISSLEDAAEEILKSEAATAEPTLLLFLLDQLEDLWPRQNENVDHLSALRESVAQLIRRSRGVSVRSRDEAPTPRTVFNAATEVALAIGIREDCVGLLDRLNNDAPISFDDLYELPLLDEEAATEAIEGPLDERNFTVDRETTRLLVWDLAHLSIQDALIGTAPATPNLMATASANGDVAASITSPIASLSIEPILLQIVMERLYDSAAIDPETGKKAITYAPSSAGGINASQMAANYFSERLDEVPERLHRVRDLCLASLVTSQGRSIAKDASELLQELRDRDSSVEEVAVTEVLKTLTDGRILRLLRSFTSSGATERFELFHSLFATLARNRAQRRLASDRELAAQHRAKAKRNFVYSFAFAIACVALSFAAAVWSHARYVKAGHHAQAAAESARQAQEEFANAESGLIKAKTAMRGLIQRHAALAMGVDRNERLLASYAALREFPGPSAYYDESGTARKKLLNVAQFVQEFEAKVTEVAAQKAQVGGLTYFAFDTLSGTAGGLFSVIVDQTSIVARATKERNCQFRIEFDPSRWPREFGDLGQTYSTITWGWDRQGYERTPIFSVNNTVRARSVIDRSFIAPTCHRYVYSVVQPSSPEATTVLFKIDLCGLAAKSGGKDVNKCRLDGL